MRGGSERGKEGVGRESGSVILGRERVRVRSMRVVR